jgi:hypothetical protein
VPLVSIAAQNKSLDNDYGATHGANAPAAHTVRLWIGDPEVDGIEVPDTTETEAGTVANGYAAVVAANDATTWAAAVDGQKVSVFIEFPAALEAYPDTITHFTTESSTDSTEVWDSGPLLEPIDITSAGDGPSAQLTIFYSTDPLIEE